MNNNPPFFINDTLVKGSSFYYSVLRLPEEKKQALMLLHALQKSLMSIIYECSEPTTAIAKLNWWQQELEAMWENKATHPITQALYPLIKQYNLPKNLFATITTHLETGFNTLFFPSFTELKHFYQTTLGSFIQLMAHILTEGKEVHAIDKLGISFGLVYHIRELRKDINKGLVFYSQEDLAHHNVNEKGLFAQETTTEIIALLHDYSQRANTIAEQINTALSPVDKKTLRPLLLWSTLQLRALDEVEKDGFRVYSHYTKLTPLRKLWVSLKK